MTIKDLIGDLAGGQEMPGEPLRENSDADRIGREIERLLVRLNRCFTETILPSVFETERDLHQAGFWNQLNIGQSTSLSSGKPNIREVTFYFYPERVRDVRRHRNITDAAYRAVFKPTGDMRKIRFSIHFPKKMSSRADTEENIRRIEEIDSSIVDDFLERFVKGAVGAYTSDRMFR